MPRQLPLERLEIHVTHACNLFCESCSHYSNHGHKGQLSLQEASDWLGPWAGRLAPRFFTLLGGEPTLHPGLAEFIPLVRAHWPQVRIDILTNGFFLHLHPRLPRVLAEDGNARICLSVHHTDPDYHARLLPNLELVTSWERDWGIQAEVRPSVLNWTRRYRGHGPTFRPFQDEDPRRSWEVCPCKASRQIHAGALWKCPPLAYLHVQALSIRLDPAWDPYLAYTPLLATASDVELEAFLAREEESACGMCPAASRPFAPPNPLRPPERTRDRG